ncbi:hypothetical protein G9A89_023839 [Geosiphon pyriformis]|nr:hypothetical protein G9A89_023839 [Geosiphon pyriformis]
MDLKTVLGGDISKKKAPKSAFHGPAGGSFVQKKKVVFGNIKHSGDERDISLSKSGPGDSMYSDVNSLFSNNVNVGMTDVYRGSFLGSTATTPKAKRVDTGMMFGSPLGSPDFTMDDNEIVLPLRISISLEKKWIDPKIVKNQVEMFVKKFFVLDINLSAVENKSAMAKTQVIRKLFSKINGFGGATTSSKFEGIIKSMFTSLESMEKAVSLVRKNNIIVNSDLKRPGVCSDRAIVIKKIPMDTPKEMIIAAVSEFGQIKTVVEFAESSQTDQFAAKWLFLIGKNSVRMAKAVRDRETWASRDWYRVLLFTLLVRTMAHDLGDLLAGADTGNRVCYAVVCFENNKVLESAFHTEPIFGGVRLSWARLDIVQCRQCGKLDHSVLKCDAETSTSPTLSRSFKRIVSNENCLQLAKLYTKKSVVSLVSSFNGSHSGSGSGFGSSSDALGVAGYSSPMNPVSSFLETRLISLKHSLELLIDKVSDIIDKLDSLNLVSLALASSSQPLVVSGSVNMKFGLDMVLDEPESVVLPPSLFGFEQFKDFDFESGLFGVKVGGSQSFDLFGIGEVRSNVCWLKFCGLFYTSMNNLVWKIAICNVRGMNNSAKQKNIIHWHRDMNNLVSIITETKLKDKVRPWIANKFDDVRVFVSGLDSGYLGSGVTIIMDNTLAKHICRVFEVPGRFLSVKLLFKNKLSVLILGLYAGASVFAHFSQVDEINSLIPKAVNESSFVILGSNFNEDGSHRCASFRKCFDLGLVNALGGNLFGKNATWTNSRGVAKTIDYVFVSLNLVNAILDHSVTRVDEYFDIDYRAVTVSMGLGGLLNVSLMFLRKQTNKNHWKFNFKNATAAKWAAFKEFSAVTMAMFKCKFDTALLFLDLNAMWDVIHKIVCLSTNDVFKKKWFKSYNNVFTKKSSKFHKLELLVSKLVKASCLVSFEKFVALLGTWNSLDTTNASVVESLFLSKSHFEVIRSVLFRVRKLYHFSKLSKSKCAEESRIRSVVSRRMESFKVNKGHIIRSVLEHLFHKVVLNHLVVDNELVLDPSLVKSKVDIIMEDWTRKRKLVTDIFADWCYQYQLLEYVFDDAFSRIMDPIGFVELLGVVSDLPNNKAAGLSGISNELWKHCDESVLNMLLVLLNSCLLYESVPHPWKEAWVSMIFKPYEISLACSTHNVLCRDNFLVLKGTMTQSPIFAIGSVVKNALEKNRELWLVLQDMKKAYDSVG